MDYLQWMGAVRMTVQTADKKHHNNPESNPHHSSASVNMLWSQKLCDCKKQIKDVFNFETAYN